MKFGCAPMSTRDQTLDLQLDVLKKTGYSEICTETLSAALPDRPALNKLMDRARLAPGDNVHASLLVHRE